MFLYEDLELFTLLQEKWKVLKALSFKKYIRWEVSV